MLFTRKNIFCTIFPIFKAKIENILLYGDANLNYVLRQSFTPCLVKFRVDDDVMCGVNVCCN